MSNEQVGRSGVYIGPRLTREIRGRRLSREIRRAVRATRWNPYSGIARYRQHIDDFQKVAPYVAAGAGYLYRKIRGAFSSSEKNDKMPPSRSVSRGRTMKRGRSPTTPSPSTSVKRVRIDSRSRSRASSSRSLKDVKGKGSSSGIVKTKTVKKTVKPLLVDGNLVASKKVQAGMQSLSQKGVVGTYEYYGSGADPDCVYMGAASVPQTETFFVFCCAFLKALCIRAGWHPVDINEVVPLKWFGTGAGGIEIYLRDVDGDTPGNAWAYTFVSTSTISIMATSMATNIKAAIAANPESYFSFVILRPNTDASAGMEFKFDLTKSMITLKSISTVKLQNSTFNVEAGEEDDDNALDVHNVPLIGKSYRTKGQSVLVHGINRGFSTRPFCATNAGGVVKFLAAQDTTSKYAEPALPSTFVGCRGHGDVSLAPGEVKSNIQIDSYRMNLNRFIYSMYYESGVTITNQKHRLGYTRFFGLEKQLNNGNATSITVGYEHNLQLGAKVDFKATVHTSQFFTKQALTT